MVIDPPRITHRMMDPRRLRYFIAVARERSFTRAANKLNIAQPPLSRRIHELEEELGTQLIDREARPLALTPTGKIFYEQSLQVMQRIDQMRRTMIRHVAAERHRLIIGLIPSGFHLRLPDIIRHYRTVAPDVEIGLREMTTAEQIVAFKENRIDVGMGRVRIEDTGIRREVLREEALLAALPPGHGLAAGATPLELAELAHLPLITYQADSNPHYGDPIVSLFRDAGVTPHSVVEVRELQTALIMVAAGIGACIIPDSARLLAHPDVLFRSLASRATSPIILNHRADDHSPALLDLLQTFADLYATWGHKVPQSILARLAQRAAAGEQASAQTLLAFR